MYTVSASNRQTCWSGLAKPKSLCIRTVLLPHADNSTGEQLPDPGKHISRNRL